MERPDYADRWADVGSQFVELTRAEDADVFVYPVDWKLVRDDAARVQEAQQFAKRARASRKPVAVFYASDHDDSVPLEGATVFRTSLSHRKRRAGEFAMPGFHEDLLEYVGGELPVREKVGKATVSFCGFVLFEEQPSGIGRVLRHRIAHTRSAILERFGRPTNLDVYVRSRAVVSLLQQRHFVDSELILRSRGGGGGWTTHISEAIRPWDQVRRDYVSSIVDSDYVLCARGIGNWSYRLYETLSLGRIPVFVESDSVLPYDFALNWRDYVVWIDRTDLSMIGARVAAFHDSLSAHDFEELQRQARRLWERYLSPQGFFSNLKMHFLD